MTMGIHAAGLNLQVARLLQSVSEPSASRLFRLHIAMTIKI